MATTAHPWSGKVFIATSLDGFIARPDGSLDWLPGAEPDDEARADAASTAPPEPDETGYTAFIGSVDRLVFGRNTYEKVLELGGWYREGLDIIVLSTTLPRDADPRIRVATSLDEALGMLDEGGAGGVYVDGGRTIQEFLRRGLIDELTITRIPVLLGEGARLFGPVDADIRLKLLELRTVLDGAEQARYRVFR